MRFLITAAVVRAAFVGGFTTRFQKLPSSKLFSLSSASSSLQSDRITLDTEGDATGQRSRDKLTRSLFGVIPGSRHSECGYLLSPRSNVVVDSPEDQFAAIEDAEAQHGMPWDESIDPKSPLLYMHFWKWQMEFMRDTLTNLKVVEIDEDFCYNENLKKKARIVNLSFQSDEYRKIRMTYYDAGESCQVFNSVWYPDARYNLPVLGIDLLAFNRKRHLCIVDYQPIHAEEDEHALAYEKRVMAGIKKDYPSINGKMSSKFYDETQFFSQQMLFARFEDESIVEKEVLPAFERYVTSHVALVKECDIVADNSLKGRMEVLERQAAYDTYSAERDPATGLFAAMFGKEWADNFVFDFLFSMSERRSDNRESRSQGVGKCSQEQRRPSESQGNQRTVRSVLQSSR